MIKSKLVDIIMLDKSWRLDKVFVFQEKESRKLKRIDKKEGIF